MIIALAGKKRCGKDTVGLMLAHKGFYKYALAAPIKEYLIKVCNNSGDLPLIVRHLNEADFNGDGYDREKRLPIDNIDVYNIMYRAWYLIQTDMNLDVFDKTVRDTLDCVLRNKEPWSIRKLMQTLGTDVAVAIKEDIWLQVMEQRTAGHENIVITDIRQVHEMEYMRGRDAKVVHILRETGESDGHITERGFIPEEHDIVIQNTGTIDELYAQVSALV